MVGRDEAVDTSVPIRCGVLVSSGWQSYGHFPLPTMMTTTIEQRLISAVFCLFGICSFVVASLSVVGHHYHIAIPGYLAAYLCCLGAKFGISYKWEFRAQVLVRNHEEEAQPDLAEVVEEVIQEGELVATPDERVRVRVRPQQAKRIASALAYAAYYEFGARERNEAELLVTRKYMRDLLREHKSLRDRDAASIIDTALYLSFLPSAALRDMNRIDQTVVFDERMQAVASWRRWYFPFGPSGRKRATAC